MCDIDMKLDGRELAGFIKQRQYQQVVSLQHLPRRPKLAIICCNEEVVSDKYSNIKQKYGEDINIAVDVYDVSFDELESQIDKLNNDPSTHGIIVQLPLPARDEEVDKLLSSIDPAKDVDTLGASSNFLPPTPNAILWLLGGYDIDVAGKNIGLIGHGRLVGRPLADLLSESGYEPQICDETSGDRQVILDTADIIVTATGQPKSLGADDIRPGVVVIDAGTASEGGVLVGDVDPAAYDRDDIKISPVPGGVGPLTVCALFENVLNAFMSQELA